MNDAEPLRYLQAQEPQPSCRSLSGLDWFAFFLADVQTGWGPFVAAYLTSVAWTQLDIGLILTLGTLVGLAMQIPAGALVDRMPAKRLLVALAVACVSGSALLLALWPVFSVVVGAKVLHAIASCVLGPALAAISLGLVGHARLSTRLGRNARYLSLGNAIAAGVMGACAYYFSNQAIFFLTAGLGLPTLLALARIRSGEIDLDLARGGMRRRNSGIWFDAFRAVVHNRALLIFAAVVVLFQLGNAAMLPIMAGQMALRAPESATLVLAVCILGPQFVVAAIAPWTGRKAQSWGRRPLLMSCFVALSIRGAFFAATSDPYLIIAVQLLDGISAATLGVLVPLVIADVTRGSGHFNFVQGVVGTAVGIGASISTTLAGYVADAFGGGVVFAFLAGVAGSGLLLVIGLMPETRGTASDA
ncbi:MAG: MFS transporter [Gammaproteobacteria bacterium]